MSNKGQLLQDPFLNTLRKEHVPVSIYLVNGIKLQGQIESFDQYVVLLRNSVTQMVYKHAISTVVPARAVSLGHQLALKHDLLEREVLAQVGAGLLLLAAVVKLVGCQQAVTHGQHAEVKRALAFAVVQRVGKRAQVAGVCGVFWLLGGQGPPSQAGKMSKRRVAGGGSMCLPSLPSPATRLPPISISDMRVILS